MPMPNFVRYVNKYVFNRWELARGSRPVLVHVGRVSKETYRTPLEPRKTESGYTFILMYGADSSDWVKNVLAAGSATLIDDGVEHELINPEICVGEKAWEQLPNSGERPPDRLNITELLRMDCADFGLPTASAASNGVDRRR